MVLAQINQSVNLTKKSEAGFISNHHHHPVIVVTYVPLLIYTERNSQAIVSSTYVKKCYIVPIRLINALVCSCIISVRIFSARIGNLTVTIYLRIPTEVVQTLHVNCSVKTRWFM